MSQESEKVCVPPTVEVSSKEKALVPDSEKSVEGVLARKNDDQSSDLPSSSENDARLLEPLKPIYENAVGILGMGVPRLACLRPAAWLSHQAIQPIFTNKASKTLARGQASRGVTIDARRAPGRAASLFPL